jgi:hypothetical protein
MFQCVRDYFAKRTLAKLLNSKYEFRSVAKLSSAVNLTPERTRELLYQVGARPAYRNENLYGLVSRVGVKARRSN